MKSPFFTKKEVEDVVFRVKNGDFFYLRNLIEAVLAWLADRLFPTMKVDIVYDFLSADVNGDNKIIVTLNDVQAKIGTALFDLFLGLYIEFEFVRLTDDLYEVHAFVENALASDRLHRLVREGRARSTKVFERLRLTKVFVAKKA